MSQDGCLPFSKFLYKLQGNCHIDANSLLAQTIVCILIILPAISQKSFGPTVYWQAIIMSDAVVSINVSYALTLLCRVVWSRITMPKGLFNLGKFGVSLNIISVIWACFFWFYTIISGVMIFSIFFWFLSGHHKFAGNFQTTD